MCEAALGDSPAAPYCDWCELLPPEYDADEDPFGDFPPKLFVLDTSSGQVSYTTSP